MKKIIRLLVFITLTLLMSLTSFAASWQSNEHGWWYLHDDGTYPVNTWEWIDGNDDGIAECYYFDANGYCLMNQQAPDGSYVDANGAWVENGVVQTIIFIDKSMRTTYPQSIGITLGTTLDTAVSIFNAYKIENYTNSLYPNNLFYYDSDGGFNNFHFNTYGVCDYVGLSYNSESKEIATAIVDDAVNTTYLNMPLVSHTNNEFQLDYTYQSPETGGVVGIGWEWQPDTGMYWIYVGGSLLQY